MQLTGRLSGSISGKQNKSQRSNKVLTASKTRDIFLTVFFAASIFAIIAPACRAASDFGSDLQVLKKYTDVVVLSNKSGSEQVAVVPKYEGRVMTSTAGGAGGLSFGFINIPVISSGKLTPHMNQFGGEDRIWLGPEGGQFGLFFKKGDPFDLTHWQVPPSVDSDAWKVQSQDSNSVSFQKNISEFNYAGTKFSVVIDRTVRLLSPGQVASDLKGTISGDIHFAAYESVNKLTNAQPTAFIRGKGLLSLWDLGQFNAGPTTVVVLPFKKGPVDKLGIIVNDTYFGKVPADRLKVDNDAGVIAFKADGHHRSKIGENARRATPNYGSYDTLHHVLTVIQYSSSKTSRDFVNSMWEIQKNPFGGDELNSYNDGGAFGPYYEIESSSPAVALGPGESITHVHLTIHLQGPPSELDPIAFRLFGVHLSQISGEFK